MFFLFFVESGAIGEALASIFLNSIFNFKGDLMSVMVTGLISGGAYCKIGSKLPTNSTHVF